MFSHWVITNSCEPMDCSPPGFSVCGISQARILKWVAISFSREPPWPRDPTHDSFIPCIGRRILYHWAIWEALTNWYIRKKSILINITTFHWLCGCFITEYSQLFRSILYKIIVIRFTYPHSIIGSTLLLLLFWTVM